MWIGVRYKVELKKKGQRDYISMYKRATVFSRFIRYI